MTIATRKERQKEELKSRILEAAKALFIEKGFEQTSIRTIAEKIEYSPTTIYLYFKDKDDMFYALHQEGFTLLNQYFRPLAHVKDPFERLKAISRAYVTFALENPEFYNLMFILQSPLKAAMKDSGDWPEGERAFDFLVSTVRECEAAGYFEGFEPEVFAFTTWSMVHGICSINICCRQNVVSEANRENLVQKATEMVVEILTRMPQRPQ
ncbi:MAG: TetR/AcrR family transcriptional regulator [Bacteroidia bacterium]|nr:TetR/AcrR family transcriptional regulator [Bacteroidia bacterium]